MSTPGADAPRGTRVETHLPEGWELRELTVDDAPALAAAFARNREHLRPWDPDRAEAFFTPDGQRQSIGAQLGLVAAGRLRTWVLHEDQAVVGRVALNSISHGVLLSASVGYWVDRERQGRGLASAMVRHALGAAWDLGLHRLEAGTQPHNHASQAVLLRCGFTRYGTAPDYLYLDGAWRDHHLFQRVLHDRPAGGAFL